MKKIINISIFLFLFSISLFANETTRRPIDFKLEKGKIYNYDFFVNSNSFNKSSNSLMFKLNANLKLNYEILDILENSDAIIAISIPHLKISYEDFEDQEDSFKFDTEITPTPATDASFYITVRNGKIINFDFAEFIKAVPESEEIFNNFLESQKEVFPNIWINFPAHDIGLNDEWKNDDNSNYKVIDCNENTFTLDIEKNSDYSEKDEHGNESFETSISNTQTVIDLKDGFFISSKASICDNEKYILQYEDQADVIEEITTQSTFEMKKIN